jgi:bifunctional enzyme CysN/CysC
MNEGAAGRRPANRASRPQHDLDGLSPRPDHRERAHVVIGGHVDHGKSTIIGRLLVDTNSLPDGKLEQVRTMCERTSKPFEYAFLLDALRDERDQGITIDTARIFFKSAQRDYIILDAPGHIEFLKNMITGASRAEAALLVVDAKEGIQENSRRHGTMLSLLGVRQIVVLVNKMDMVDFAESAFDAVVGTISEFLAHLDVQVAHNIPVCGREGDNIVLASTRMPWYSGPTLLQALDGFRTESPPVDKPFRMPVQNVFKFTKFGDDRRIVAGTVDTGLLRSGDTVVFYPSGKKTTVKTLEAFGAGPPTAAQAGMATGFTMTEQVYVERGELATRADEPPPKVSTRLRASLFWLGRTPLAEGGEYTMKLGSARVAMRVEGIERVIDASDLSSTQRKKHVNRHEVADCIIRLNRALAFDPSSEMTSTGRFVVVHDYEIQGGGIIREALPDHHAAIRQKVLVRNYKWEASLIPPDRRAEKYSQKPLLLLITGDQSTDRKAVAKEIEAQLLSDGKIVYYLGIGNVLYGVDADLERSADNRREHLRRLGEVANLMLDAGIILVVSAGDLTQEDLEVIKATVTSDMIQTVWVGDRLTTDLICDIVLADAEKDEAVGRVKGLLQDKGIIFRPW